MTSITNTILNQNSVISLLDESEKAFVLGQLNLPYSSSLNNGEVLRLSFFLINSIFLSPESETIQTKTIAYKLLKSINITTEEGVSLFTEIFGIDGVDSPTLYYFYLANTALISEKQISIRIDLKAFQNTIIEDSNWKYLLINNVLVAYILLVRKQNGFSDVEAALKIIDNLKEEQKKFEDLYLKQFSIENEVNEAYILLSLYHLSKAIVETANYLKQGYEYRGRLDAVIRQHLDIAKKIAPNDPRLVSVLTMFEFGLNAMYKNAISSKN